MSIRFHPLPTDLVRALQAGAPDANGQTPERAVSDGDGAPCRHCMTDIAEGRPMLILSHRPFPAPQPYAEQGPVFLCADPCEAWSGDGLPDIYRRRERMLIRGYDANDRIIYGTGVAAPTAELEAMAERLLERPEIAYLHMRSATDNCFHARIERA